MGFPGVGNCMAACPWPALACLSQFPVVIGAQTVSKVVHPDPSPPMFAMAMWVSLTSDAACAAALQQAVVDFGVVDTDALQAVLQIPETAAVDSLGLCAQPFRQRRPQSRAKPMNMPMKHR